MPWIYLVESEAYLLPCEITAEQSPIAKSNRIAKVSSCRECKKGICAKHQFGTTYELYHLKNFHQSTLFAEGFHAKIFQLQDGEQAWKESEAGFFSRSCAWPKKSSPHSYSLKTSQPSLGEGVFEWLESLPKQGMIADGVLYPLQALERSTKESAGSFWLTPSTMDNLPVREGEALENALHRGKNRDSRRKVSGRLNEQVAYPQMWPTPKARDFRDSGESPGDRRRNSPSLPCVVKTLVATPTASQASKPIRAPSPTRANGTHGEDLQDSIGRLNPEMIGKKLSVQFVECLMGFPTKWTELKPLETP